jgi:HD superfamily phosphohydrolase
MSKKEKEAAAMEAAERNNFIQMSDKLVKGECNYCGGPFHRFGDCAARLHDIKHGCFLAHASDACLEFRKSKGHPCTRPPPGTYPKWPGHTSDSPPTAASGTPAPTATAPSQNVASLNTTNQLDGIQKLLEQMSTRLDAQAQEISSITSGHEQVNNIIAQLTESE